MTDASREVTESVICDHDTWNPLSAGAEALRLEKLPELVGSEAGLPDDGVEGPAFQVFVVVRDSDSESQIVRMLEEVMGALGVVNKKACPL